MNIRTIPSADDFATRYAYDVLSGKEVAGDFVKGACRRHLKDLEDGSKRGLVYNVEKAKFACDFFPSVLTVTEGVKEGMPFSLLRWHEFVVGSIYGWRRSDGFRRFRMAWLETGKGQAKSPLMAAIGLLMLGFEGKQRSEVYAIASDRDQANVLFKDAVAMCRATMPECDDGDSLESRGEVIIRGTADNAWKIEHPSSQSKFQSLASGEAISGPKPYAVLADEIHEFKSPYALQIWKAAIDKMSGDPLMLLGTNTPASNQLVGTEYSEMFQKIATDQAQDDSLFSFIARVDKTDDPFKDESCWAKSLPALGITYPIDNIRQRVKTAQLLLSESLSTKRLYFGIPVGTDGFWISEEAWNSCQGSVEEKELRKLPCWLGLDLSKKNDLTALSACWHNPKDDFRWVKTWYFTTKAGIHDRSRDDNATYDMWAEKGLIEAVPGATIDYEFVAYRVQYLCREHNVQFLTFDPAKIDDFIDACERIGFKVWKYKGPDEPPGVGLKLVSHGQGTRVVFTEKALCMPRSIENLEDAILNEKIIIENSPVTTMCASNAAIIADAMNNRAFDKKRSRGRIDGMISISQSVGASKSELDVAKEPQYQMLFVG